MLKEIIVIILLIGIIYLVYRYTKENDKEATAPPLQEPFCPLPIPEYRYIPRSFEEEQKSEIYPSEVFETMFSQPSPWLLSIRNFDRKKQWMVNTYFVSQL